MAEDASVAFTIVQEGACQGRPDKKFTLKRGASNAFRIGRAPGNDLVLEFRGVSQYHAELRLESVGGQLRLCVRDLSMNGTGLQKPDAKVPVHLTKLADEPVQHESLILVPMLLKANADTSSRALLRVQFDDPSEADGLGAAPAEGANGKDGAGSGEEDDVEKNRMEFVDLLLKTKEVNSSTTFEDARALLEKEAAWHAVDEETRKECFDIFVEHLGSHSSKKKDKKKKDKGKDKKKKEEEKEEPKKGRRKGSRSGSEGKGRKGKKKGGSDDDKSRSRSRSPGDKRRKRRRGHSSD